jgi:hypothetical protein
VSERFDPYAAPKAAIVVGEASTTWLVGSAALDEARRALQAHTHDAEAIVADRKIAGGKFRRATLVIGALTATSIVATIALGSSIDDVAIWIGGGFFSGLMALFFVVFLIIDVMVGRRDQKAPDRLMLAYLRSCRFARFGFAQTCLAPTARKATLSTPELTPVATQPTTVIPETPAAYGTFLKSFAVNGGSAQRLMVQKRVQLLDVRGDLARVEIEVRYESVPRLAVIIGIVGFVIFRPLIILYLVLYFVLRKTRTCVAQKLLLFGADGAWYLLDGDPTRSDELA